MTHLAEADTVKDKQRLGFFSVPISTAIGDDGPYKTRIRKSIDIQILAMNRGSLRPRPVISRPRLLVPDNSTNPSLAHSIALPLLARMMSLSKNHGGWLSRTTN